MRGPILLYLHLNRAVRTTMKILFLFSQQMKHCIDSIEIFIQNSPCQTSKCEHRCRFHTFVYCTFLFRFHTFVYCTFLSRIQPARRQSVNIAVISTLLFICSDNQLLVILRSDEMRSCGMHLSENLDTKSPPPTGQRFCKTDMENSKIIPFLRWL